MRKYFNFKIKKAISVSNLVTLEYLNLSSSYIYNEEVHDFYEFIYVDSGSLECNSENAAITLSQNDFYLIPPDVKHFYSTKPNCNASVFIVCFNSASNIAEILSNVTHLEKHEKQLVSKILSESQKAFRFPFDKKLIPIENPVFGAQQLIENTIEELLINLVRLKLNENSDIKIVMSSLELEDNLVRDIVSILNDNVYGNISLDEISKKTYYSKTYLNNIFKKNFRSSIMHYYVTLKIKEGKKLLKDGLTVTEASDKLSFDSPNYFSKVFKKYTGITPSQYKQLIY